MDVFNPPYIQRNPVPGNLKVIHHFHYFKFFYMQINFRESPDFTWPEIDEMMKLSKIRSFYCSLVCICVSCLIFLLRFLCTLMGKFMSHIFLHLVIPLISCLFP